MANAGAGAGEKPEPFRFIVLSGAYERVHYALATAAAAAAMDRPVILFFTQGAVRALVAGGKDAPGWHRLSAIEPGLGGHDAASRDRAFRERGAAGFEELLAACGELRVIFLVCSMGLRVAGVDRSELRADLAIEETGLTDILARAGSLAFI
jgi:peroxiredoxin family protein